MYPIQNGRSFLVQQSVTGTGRYASAAYGRALGRFPHGAAPGDSAVVRVSSKLLGTLANAFTIAFLDAGAGVTVSTTTVNQLGSVFNVNLRRSSGALLATAQEVAAAVNAANLAIVASYEGSGNGVVSAFTATSIGNLSVGVDPATRGANVDQYVWSLPVDVDGGFFYFEQNEPVLVHQFEALFNVASGGPYTVTVSRTNLDANLEPIIAETIPVFVWDSLTVARPDAAFSGEAILLHPKQALVVAVTGGLNGVVRFDVRKTAGYPYP